MAHHADPVLQMSLEPKRRYSLNCAADQISAFETYSELLLQTLPKTSAV